MFPVKTQTQKFWLVAGWAWYHYHWLDGGWAVELLIIHIHFPIRASIRLKNLIENLGLLKSMISLRIMCAVGAQTYVEQDREINRCVWSPCLPQKTISRLKFIFSRWEHLSSCITWSGLLFSCQINSWKCPLLVWMDNMLPQIPEFATL